LEPDDAQTLRRGQTSLFAGAARHVRRCTRPLDALDSLMEDGSTPTATLLLGTRRLTPLLQVNVQLAESRFCHGLVGGENGGREPEESSHLAHHSRQCL